MKSLLSIVVPTKDRYKYLKHLISLIESFSTTEIELILQDNTENNSEIMEYLNQHDYPFLKYLHCKDQLSVKDNSDLAILNSTGEYVCYIGDDDGVTRHIIDCVRWMKENDVDALISSVVDYYWPDYINNRNMSATIFYKPFSKSFEVTDPMKVMKEIMKKGFINRGNLPSVYQGIVKREILDKVYSIGGTFFPGPSPDIANAVALCFVINKYVRIDFPIIITGASMMNGGGIRKLKNQIANIEDLPFLPKNSKENWEANIPRVWTGETVWPESAIKALRYMDREDLIKKVDFEYMLGRFILFHSHDMGMAIKLSKNKFRLFWHLSTMLLHRYYGGLKGLFTRKILKKYNGRIILYNQSDIIQVNARLMEIEPIFITQDKK